MNDARLNDPRVRGIAYQALLLLTVGVLVAGGAYNAYVNMKARGIPMGFGFWNQVAGFDINLHLIPYSAVSTYGQAFWVGLLNTLLVAAICIPLATLVGFAVGVARLSPNWLMSRSALVYTNVLRNTPLLLLVAVLVQCGPEILAGAAPVDRPRRPRLSQQPGTLPAGAGHASRGKILLRRARSGSGRLSRVSNLGAAPSDAHRGPGPCRARLGGASSRAPRGRGCRGRGAVFPRRIQAQRLQSEGRNPGHSGVGRA